MLREESVDTEAGWKAGERWLTAMRRGDFEAAWRESDALRRGGYPDPHRLWDGTELRGRRVMVRSLHGLGDAVQMLRYAPTLRVLAEHVTYQVAPRLVELASCFDGVEHVTTWGDEAAAAEPEWDVQVEVMELPYILRTTVAELPLARRYLHLPQPRLEAAAGLMKGRTSGLRIGLMWTAGSWNEERSLAFELLEPLLASCAAEGWEVWSLHHSQRCSAERGMRDATQECGDGLVALGAAIANLDLVITVDTLAAHLAGALGVPAWVMLQHAADWRWMAGRNDSPWYPSVRLFRQPVPGDWSGVIAAVAQALTQLTPRADRLVA